MIRVVVSYDDAGAMCYVYQHGKVISLLAVGEAGQEGAQTGALAVKSARASFRQYRKNKRQR